MSHEAALPVPTHCVNYAGSGLVFSNMPVLRGKLRPEQFWPCLRGIETWEVLTSPSHHTLPSFLTSLWASGPNLCSIRPGRPSQTSGRIYGFSKESLATPLGHLGKGQELEKQNLEQIHRLGDGVSAKAALEGARQDLALSDD